MCAIQMRNSLSLSLSAALFLDRSIDGFNGQLYDAIMEALQLLNSLIFTSASYKCSVKQQTAQTFEANELLEKPIFFLFSF